MIHPVSLILGYTIDGSIRNFVHYPTKKRAAFSGRVNTSPSSSITQELLFEK
jgi:hypothetical protein